MWTRMVEMKYVHGEFSYILLAFGHMNGCDHGFGIETALYTPILGPNVYAFMTVSSSSRGMVVELNRPDEGRRLSYIESVIYGEGVV